MDTVSLTRRQAYRLAGRNFRYPVYVALEIAWALGAVLVLAMAVWKSPNGWLVAFLAALSVAHSASMTVTMPWLLLKSAVFGGIIFGVAYALEQLFALLTNPVSVSAVAASMYYLWLGERWTMDRARQAMHDAEAT